MKNVPQISVLETNMRKLLLVETGTIKGNAGKFTLGTTTRAEMAQVLYNLMTKQLN